MNRTESRSPHHAHSCPRMVFFSWAFQRGAAHNLPIVYYLHRERDIENNSVTKLSRIRADWILVRVHIDT